MQNAEPRQGPKQMEIGIDYTVTPPCTGTSQTEHQIAQVYDILQTKQHVIPCRDLVYSGRDDIDMLGQMMYVVDGSLLTSKGKVHKYPREQKF